MHCRKSLALGLSVLGAWASRGINPRHQPRSDRRAIAIKRLAHACQIDDSMSLFGRTAASCKPGATLRQGDGFSFGTPYSADSSCRVVWRRACRACASLPCGCCREIDSTAMARSRHTRHSCRAWPPQDGRRAGGHDRRRCARYGKSRRVALWLQSATVCSMAPKIEWFCASSISMRTTSPGFNHGVTAAPPSMVSTMRSSAMQL